MPQLNKTDKSIGTLGENRLALEQTISILGKAEREHIKSEFYEILRLWADLLDQVESIPQNSFESLSETRHNQFNESRNDYSAILSDISSLDFKTNAQALDHINSRVLAFKNSGRAEDLASILSISNALNSEARDVAELKSLISRARDERKIFDASFTKNIERQRRATSRTLAKYYRERINEIESEPHTNPANLLAARNMWSRILVETIVLFSLSYYLLSVFNLISTSEIGLLASKAAILFVLSAQVYFKQRNFNIYSDMVAKYKHMLIVASTLTDYLHEDTDQTLKTKMVEIGVSTMFSGIDTGHLKQSDFHNNDKVTNIVEYLPKQ